MMLLRPAQLCAAQPMRGAAYAQLSQKTKNPQVIE